MTADLDAALAAEEHRQGRPYLAEPEHCQVCAEVDLAWMQAVCAHDNAETIEFRSLDSATHDEITSCADCGLTKRLVQFTQIGACE